MLKLCPNYSLVPLGFRLSAVLSSSLRIRSLPPKTCSLLIKHSIMGKVKPLERDSVPFPIQVQSSLVAYFGQILFEHHLLKKVFQFRLREIFPCCLNSSLSSNFVQLCRSYFSGQLIKKLGGLFFSWGNRIQRLKKQV